MWIRGGENNLPFKPFIMSEILGNPLFALFCANLQYYWPSLPVSSYRRLYSDLIQRQHFLLQDQQLLDLFSNVHIPIEQRERFVEMRQQKGIILTFHTGAYRVLPRLLCELGFNIALLASAKVREEQMEGLGVQHAGIRQTDSKTGDFIILDAEQGGSLLQVRKALRDGYHILVYADGNTGRQQKQKDNGHSLGIPFFKRSILQRTAIACLSYRWQLPIYSILGSKKNEQISFSLGEPTLWDEYRDAETYCKILYTRLYADLERLIWDDPMTWEGWRYVLPRSKGNAYVWSKRYYGWNTSRLWPLFMNGTYYALDSQYLHSHTLHVRAYDRLCRGKSKLLSG